MLGNVSVAEAGLIPVSPQGWEGAGALAQFSLGPTLELHPHSGGEKDFQENAAPTARSASKYVDH